MDVWKLSLTRNQLENITRTPFKNLSRLQWLNLEFNRLKSIDPDAFEALISLEYLNLESNHLVMHNLRSCMFSHLDNLKTLRLANQKTPGPSDFIFNLIHLEVISLDVVNENLTFDSRFCHLSNLSRLGIDVGVSQLTSTGFDQLSCLDIQEIYMQNILVTWISSLKNFPDLSLNPIARSLRSLHLDNVWIHLHDVLTYLEPLQNKSMFEISLNRISFFEYPSAADSIIHRDGILDCNSTKFLKNICVERLSITQALVYVVKNDAFPSNSALVRCLKYLDFSGNSLLGTSFALFRALTLPKIEVIIYESAHTQESAMDNSIRNKSVPLESAIPKITDTTDNFFRDIDIAHPLKINDHYRFNTTESISLEPNRIYMSKTFNQ